MPSATLTAERQIRRRYSWCEKAKRLGNVTLACCRLGISRKTFYRWRKRYQQARGDGSTPTSESSSVTHGD